MKKAALTALLAVVSFSLFGFCPIVTTLSNGAIPCASGLSSTPAEVQAYLWIQGKADWATNGTAQVSPGFCTAGGTTGGCDSDGVDIMDETCLFDGTSIMGPWDLCASGSPGEYYLFTDWANYVFDGCPSNDSSERAILLIYDNTGKYVLQSRSQGKDWDNWDEIGTTAAAYQLTAPGVYYYEGAELSLPYVPGSVIYGSYSAGDAPSAQLVTGRRIYYYFGCTPPSKATSVWTAGPSYPLDTTSIMDYDFPAAPEGLWVAYTLIVDGHELPFVSNYIQVPWHVEGTAVDEDPCSCTGMTLYPDHGCWDCVPFVDVLIDGTELHQSILIGFETGGWLYHGTCNVQHSIQFRGHYYGETYSCWSDPIYATDAGIETPTTPVITSITDNDPNSNSGVTINYTPGTPVLRHDLYRDGYLIQTNFTSGSTVTGLDCNGSHSFRIVAISDPECWTVYSAPVSATVRCVGAPGELALGETSGDALIFSIDETTANWPSYTGATGYRLYRGSQADLPNLPGGAVDNSCLKYDGASTSIDLSGDTPTSGSFFWYLVTAYNGNGEGPAGTGRIINSSGGCP